MAMNYGISAGRQRFDSRRDLDIYERGRASDQNCFNASEKPHITSPASGCHNTPITSIVVLWKQETSQPSNWRVHGVKRRLFSIEKMRKY